jgi:hypothetical protein
MMMAKHGMAIVELGQAPNPKRQIPNKLSCLPAGIRNGLNPKQNRFRLFEIGIYLGFGVWYLELEIEATLHWIQAGVRLNVRNGI